MASVVTYLPAQLPVPAVAGGVSAAVDVTTCAGPFTFACQGNQGDVIVVQASPDGLALWSDLCRLNNNGLVETPADIVVGHLRLVRRVVDPSPGGVLVTPQVSMTAQPAPGGYSYSTAAVVVPAADGVGAGVDITTFDLTNEVNLGAEKAIVCSAFDGGDVLSLEASADGNAPWVPVMQLQPGRILPIAPSLGHIRIRRTRIPSAGPRVGVDGATATFMGWAVTSSGGGAESNAGYALQFTGGTEIQGVLMGDFMPVATNLGVCLWEAWVAPGDDAAGIIFVIGTGGLHAMLLEFIDGGPGTLNRLNGNMLFTDPGNGIGFNSYDGLWPNEPGHVACIFDGTSVLLFVNGVCSAKYPTPAGFFRQAQNLPYGGQLCVNSNGHAQRGGLMQQLRIWDGTAASPPTLPKTGSNWEIYPGGGPESLFGGSFLFGDGSSTYCQGLWHFTQPAAVVVDMAPLPMGGQRHPGNLVNMRDLDAVFIGTPGNVFPRPEYVPAPLFPARLGPAPVGGGGQPIINKPASALPTPPAVAGALLAGDDFSDGWNTYAFDNGVRFPFYHFKIPQLPASKYGSLGPLPYAQNNGYTTLNQPAAWGSDNLGNAVILDQTPSTATLDVGTADYDVMVERVGPAAPNGTNGELGIAFRKIDELNYYFLQAIYDPFAGGTPMTLWMFKVTAGTAGALDAGQVLQLATPNDTWHWLRCRVKGTTFQAFIDDGAGGWTQVGADVTGQVSFAAGTNVGLYGASSLATYQSSRMRTASLMIYTAP